MRNLHLYLDTNVILDAMFKRYTASESLVDRIRKEKWRCSTSRFTMLEMLDIRHEEVFADKLISEGMLPSRVRDYMGVRRQEKWALPKRELDEIRAELFDKLNTDFKFIKFRHPLTSRIWDKADDFCAITCIAAPDVIHLASAIELKCDMIITRDGDFHKIADQFKLTIFPEQIENALKELSRGRRINYGKK